MLLIDREISDNITLKHIRNVQILVCPSGKNSKRNANTNLKTGFKEHFLLLLFCAGGGEDDSFVLPT